MGIRFIEEDTTPQASTGSIRFLNENEQSTSALSGLGRGLASLADVTVGGVLPAIAQTVAYPVARTFQTPEQAQATTERVVSAIDKPFGKAAGVTETPEYKAEAGRQLMEFIGTNFQKGAQWLAEKTGLPTQDVESYMSTLTLAAPAAVKAATPVVKEAVGTAAELAKKPVEPYLQARRERLSAEDYTRGPQIDAAAEAKRLGIALEPTDIQQTAGKKVATYVAGVEGVDRIQQANKQNVRKVALNEMGLPETAQLDKASSFNEARTKVAKPYNEIRKLPTMTADELTIKALEELRPDDALISSDLYAKATNKRIDRAVKKVSEGLDGTQLLENVTDLRQKARKIYNNKNASLEALDSADTFLAIANTLEKMVESNVSNPKLLQEFRNARQKMAKIYAYEGATDLNTGIIDVNRLAKITAKDNAMTGDIAALGKIAGNFPDAFTTKASHKLTKGERFSRATPAGSLGGILGYTLGGDYVSAAAGSVLGAIAGDLTSSAMAKRIASPEYQAGLNLRDMRIPIQQMAAPVSPPIPQSQAIVPYQAPVEVLNKGEGPYQPNFTLEPNRYPPNVSVITPESSRALPAPSAESTMAALRAEDTRRAQVSREIGRQQELKQASVEASGRKPATGGVVLELDPVTGRLKETSQGVKGATPETFQNFGTSLENASKKVAEGKLFDLTAAEKVAWDKTKTDLAEAAPSFRTLSNKELAERMLDRQWVAEAAQKARDKAMAFEQAAYRAKTAREVETAKANRERMLDLAEQMEAKLGGRPDLSRKIQGPKTRAAKKEEAMGLFRIDLTGMARPD